MKLRSALYAGVLMLVSVCAAAQAVKIGYVNTFRIENESAQAVRAIATLKQEFDPRHQKLEDLQKRAAAARDELEKTAASMPLAERQAKERELTGMMKQAEQMRVAFSEDLELRKNQERVRISEEADIVIKAVAEAGKYDLILQEATYSSHAIDITGQVLKEMARRAGTAPGSGK